MLNLGVSLQRLATKAGVGFTPRKLFSNGEAGVWYDPSAASGSLDWRRNLLEYTESFDNSYWSKIRGTVVAESVTDPFGGTNANSLTATDFAETYVHRTVTIPEGSVVTFSGYIKKNNSDYCHLLLWSTTTTGVRCWFNLNNGTVASNAGFGTGYTFSDASIESMGNGWYRCSLTVNAQSGTSINSRFQPSNGDGDVNSSVGKSIYIFGAQLEQSSTATEYQPIRSTFEDAFKFANPKHTLYQDSNGQTPVTAVGEPVGLMLDKSRGLSEGSEEITNGDFSNGLTGWSKVNTNSTNTITVNNGAVDIVGDGTVALNLNQTSAFTIGKVYRLTVDATVNAGNVGGIKIQYSGNDSSIGIITESGSYSFTFRPTSTTLEILRRNSGQATNVTIDNVSVKEIQGSHARQSTSTKRPIYARHPEGGIRNLLNYTEQFDNGYWNKLDGSSVTVNAGVAPNGTQTADRLSFSTSVLSRVEKSLLGLGANVTVTYSVWLKSESGTQNLQIGTSGTSKTSVTATTEWQRFTHTATDADGNVYPRVENSDDGVARSVLSWGWQLEIANEASNYQKVVTDIDVTESGVGEVYYLKFDGADDGMQINNLTSPSTPLTALFGYSSTSAESFTFDYLIDIQTGRTIFGASSNVAGKIGYFDGAWSDFEADANAIKVLTYDLVENDAKMRVDGTQEYSDTTYDQKSITGSIGLFTGYGTGGELAGNMYQTVLRAAESTDEEIAKAETFVANKTGLKAQVDGIATLDLNFGANTYTAKNSNGGVI